MNNSNAHCNMDAEEEDVRCECSKIIKEEVKTEVKSEFKEENSNVVETGNGVNAELKYEDNDHMKKEVKQENEEDKKVVKVKEEILDKIKEEMVEAYEEFEYLPEDTDNDVKPGTAETEFPVDDSTGQQHRDKRPRNESSLSEKPSTSPQCLPTELSRLLECTKCFFIATKVSTIHQHQTVHTTKPPFDCTKCKFGNSNSRDFNNHILSCNEDKPYICGHCGKGFSRTSVLKVHLKSQHSGITKVKPGPKPNINQSPSEVSILSCKKCKFFATKSSSIDQHQTIHTTKSPFYCTKCNSYESSRTGNFNKHILTCNKDKPRICRHCGMGFGENCRLKDHIKSQHAGTNTVLRCDKCEFTTLLATKMKNHVEQLHPADRVILKCQKCNFIATKSSSLDLHQLVHTSEKPYHCGISNCDYQNVLYSNFNFHILSHNRDRPYVCPQCGNSYTQSTQLKYHQQDGTCFRSLI